MKMYLYGIPELQRRWWGREFERPPVVEGHTWMLVAEVEVPRA